MVKSTGSRVSYGFEPLLHHVSLYHLGYSLNLLHSLTQYIFIEFWLYVRTVQSARDTVILKKEKAMVHTLFQNLQINGETKVKKWPAKII